MSSALFENGKFVHEKYISVLVAMDEGKVNMWLREEGRWKVNLVTRKGVHFNPPPKKKKTLEDLLTQSRVPTFKSAPKAT